MDFRQQKKTVQKTPPETKRSEKTLGIYKRNKTPNMPTSEELRGDSPSGLAANAPFRSGSKVDLLSEFKRVVWRVLDRDAKRRACIVKHPPKCHLEFFHCLSLFLVYLIRDIFLFLMA